MKKYLVFLVFFSLLCPIARGQVLTGAIPNDPGELTLGSVWMFSAQSVVLAENTWQFQPDGYTQGRGAVALAYSW